MIQDFNLDTYNYEKWNNKRASKKLEDKKTEFDLIDIWRTKNLNIKRFSWWKKTPRKAGRLIISEEKRGPGSWKLNTDLLKDKDLQTKIREELKLIKRTYALTPYEQNNLEVNEINIEYNIKADVMWEVMLVQIRGIIINFAKQKKKREMRREKELIKQIDKLEENMQLNLEQLEVLNIELAILREDRIKGAKVRARSLKLNEGERPSSAMNFLRYSRKT